MKSIYIILCRSGTLLSRIVYHMTGDPYTHVSLAFDEGLGTLYSSSRKNGYTMFPAGPCKEFLDRGVLGQNGQVPCAVYELRVGEDAYWKAYALAESLMAPWYGFNIFGLLLCRLNIRLQRRRHFFCSQFVAQVLEDSRSLHLPKDRTLMRPGDYARLRKLRCVYKGTLQELRRRQGMEVTPPVSCTAIYMQLLWTAARRRWAGMAGSR